VTKSDLEKLRDELADKTYGELSYEFESEFINGFNAALELMWPCVKALEECRHGECIGNHIAFYCKCPKCKALSDLERKVRGE